MTMGEEGMMEFLDVSSDLKDLIDFFLVFWQFHVRKVVRNVMMPVRPVPVVSLVKVFNGGFMLTYSVKGAGILVEYRRGILHCVIDRSFSVSD